MTKQMTSQRSNAKERIQLEARFGGKLQQIIQIRRHGGAGWIRNKGIGIRRIEYCSGAFEISISEFTLRTAFCSVVGCHQRAPCRSWKWRRALETEELAHSSGRLRVKTSSSELNIP